jgi:hypothetical protein
MSDFFCRLPLFNTVKLNFKPLKPLYYEKDYNTGSHNVIGFYIS